MTKREQEALEEIRGLASANRYALSPHAFERMLLRNVRPMDVRHALVKARDCREQTEGRWKVLGPDLDKDDLTMVVVVEDGVVVITLF